MSLYSDPADIPDDKEREREAVSVGKFPDKAGEGGREEVER